jgi:hypothetical protein
VVRPDGREPIGPGAAIGAPVIERTWKLSDASASLREWWVAVALGLAGYVAAVGYDADTGRPTVCPEPPARGDEVRLE